MRKISLIFFPAIELDEILGKTTPQILNVLFQRYQAFLGDEPMDIFETSQSAIGEQFGLGEYMSYTPEMAAMLPEEMLLAMEQVNQQRREQEKTIEMKLEEINMRGANLQELEKVNGKMKKRMSTQLDELKSKVLDWETVTVKVETTFTELFDINVRSFLTVTDNFVDR